MRGAVFALALLLPATSAAGPWTPAPGHGYAKAWVHWLPGVGWFAEPGSEPAFYGFYSEVAAGTYAELGVAEGVAVVAHWMPLRTYLLADPRAGVPAQLHASVGEPLVGIKLRPVRVKRFVLGVEAGVRAPTGRNLPVQEVVSVADGNPKLGDLRIDSGAWDVTGGLSAGLGFDKWYGAAAVAWTWRSEGYDSVLTWSVEAGRGLGTKGLWSARLRISGQHALGDGTAPYHASPSGLGNGTTVVAFTLEAERKVADGWWLGFSVAGGLAPVIRQTGGPAITGFVAHAF